MVFDCDKFYLVKPDDGCEAIATEYNVSLSDFYAWNPAVGDECFYIVQNSSMLLRLPLEIVACITSLLPNRDRKNLRLTCRHMGNAARLRLDRVFLSANPRNIEVLRAIADHDNYRCGVVELVWDDARLSDKEASADWDVEEWGLTVEPGSWFERQMQKNLDILVHRRTPDDLKLPYHAARAEQVASQMPVEEAKSLYRELLRQQEEVMASGADVEALSYALNRFSSLRRVVITPATHGFLFTPLYETPMIRALPRGFNYAIPRGWPTEEGVQRGPVARAWNDADEAYRAQWRGFRLVVRVLAQRPPPAPGVSEIVVMAAQLRTGLNCRIFDEPCPELDDFCALLRRPGFARLDLDLLVGGQDRIGWSSFRSGHLQRALAGSKSMRHVSLSTDVLSDPDTRATKQLIPLATIFPVEQWAHLRHFGLSRFPVDQGDVVALLKVLPATLQSVELSFLLFLDECGSYRDLLRHMRRELGKWRDREVRLHTIVGVEQHIPVIGRGIWLETEVDRFLYEEGPNPFGGEDHWDPDLPLPGFGIVKDKFEPDEYTRPNKEYAKMVQLGYYEGPALVRMG